MVDLSTIQHHPAVEELVDVLTVKLQNDDPAFFRVIVAYFLSVAAGTMRARIMTKDRGEIPVNSYAVALAGSGSGKGHSLGILEEYFFKDFRSVFTEQTLPMLAESNMFKIANKRAAYNGTEEQLEFDALNREYEQTGAYPFVFDSGSAEAIKQIRQKLLLAGVGSINLQVDEIGSNLEGVQAALNAFLELYDQGKIKDKVTKNGADNKRTTPIEGKTPANLLMIGTDDALLDGAKTEAMFNSLLSTGLARRSIFAMGHPRRTSLEMTDEEVYNALSDPGNVAQIDKWAMHFSHLADPTKYDWLIDLPDDVGIELTKYRRECEREADRMSRYDGIRKAELSHRYYKTLRLAGAYAFVDESMQITMYHLHAAMKLVEESGKAFEEILTQEKGYMKLARYIAEKGKNLTHADLSEALPFYKGTNSYRQDMMTMATAWGHKQHIMIKKSYIKTIELFSGETLKETNLDELKLSYSEDFAYNYESAEAPFDQLHTLTQLQDYHWANHSFKAGHRNEENTLPGFNMVVIDVDGGVPLSYVHDLLGDYTFMTYTTKRHTPDNNRFRLIMPMNYELNLDSDDYVEFMKNVVKWLPFATDEKANQRCRKWLTHDAGNYHYNIPDDKKLLDILPFVPKTSNNEDFHKGITQLGSLDNLERWFATRMTNGDRNNQMIKFALALVDSGMDYVTIEEKVTNFDNQLPDPLGPVELRKTVLVTVARKLQALAA